MTETHLPGLVIRDHEFPVPLNHAQPDGPQISVFVREVAAPDGPERGYLVFFQGGPGSEAPRPIPPVSGWLKRALKDFRVLLLDQRGTGRSTPIGSLPDMSPPEQADYLRHFRADAIVRDAELIRERLGVERWSVLGQSFGGFCVANYLSSFPGALKEAFITAGLPAIGCRLDGVYGLTYATTLARNRRYFERYPSDRRRIEDLRGILTDSSVTLPSGDRLTWRRFRQLGSMLGMSDGAERLHYVLELPAESRAFRHDVEAATHFGRNPIYSVLHEACWADGGVTAWAAERAMPDEFRNEPLLTGEHIFPWMFEDYNELQPLREAAELLAQTEWPRLYDSSVLARNEVRVAAAVYLEDMYVPYDFSKETAGLIRGLQAWVTNEYDHNGLRADGERILGRLMDMTRGT